MTPAVEAQSLNPWTTRQVPKALFFNTDTRTHPRLRAAFLYGHSGRAPENKIKLDKSVSLEVGPDSPTFLKSLSGDSKMQAELRSSYLASDEVTNKVLRLIPGRTGARTHLLAPGRRATLPPWIHTWSRGAGQWEEHV